MSQIYTYPKSEVLGFPIDTITLHFNNRDELRLQKEEILAINMVLGDHLIWTDENICFTLVGGSLELELQNQYTSRYDGFTLCRRNDYRTDRIGYIRRRALANEIAYISIHDECNFSYTLYTTVTAKGANDRLSLSFRGGDTAENELASIMLPTFGKNLLRSLQLDFENCDVLDLYREDILDLQLNYNQRLCFGHNLNREIQSGYIIIKLDKQERSRPFSGMFDNHLSHRKIKKRICPERGISPHDICHLYLSTDLQCCVECLHIDDIRPADELDRLYDLADGEDINPCFIGGFSKRLRGRRLLLTFGKNAQATLEKLAAQDL